MVLYTKCKAYVGIGQAILLFLVTSSVTAPHIEAISSVNDKDCNSESQYKGVHVVQQARAVLKDLFLIHYNYRRSREGRIYAWRCMVLIADIPLWESKHVLGMGRCPLLPSDGVIVPG